MYTAQTVALAGAAARLCLDSCVCICTFWQQLLQRCCTFTSSNCLVVRATLLGTGLAVAPFLLLALEGFLSQFVHSTSCAACYAV